MLQNFCILWWTQSQFITEYINCGVFWAGKSLHRPGELCFHSTDWDFRNSAWTLHGTAKKKKKVSTVQKRTTEKYPENAILLWNMDEIIADKCHSDKTLWHNQVPLRDKGVSESKQKLQWDDLFWQDTANPRKKHPCLLQENRLGSLESLHECFKEVKVWITGQEGKIILGLNVAFMETTWWILYQSYFL